MPADPDVVRRITQDPEFEQLSEEGKLDTMRSYMHQTDEDFRGLHPDEQMHTAYQLIQAHQPGALRRFAEAYAPVIGPVLHAARAPEQIRPWTRAAAGLVGADEAVKTPFGAATAEALREVATLGLLHFAGGPLISKVAEPVIGATVGRLVPGLVEKGVTAALDSGVAAAVPSLTKAGTQALIERVAHGAVEGSLIGPLFHIADSVERHETPTIGGLLASAGSMAAFSAGLSGLGAVATRFGSRAAQEAAQRLQSDRDVQTAVSQARPIQQGYARLAGVDQEAAGDVVTRAIGGELLDPDEFKVMRRVLTSDPAMLKNEATLRILQTQKEHLVPSAKQAPLSIEEEPPGPLSVRHENRQGGTTTSYPANEQQMQRLIAQHHSRDIHILPEGIDGEGAQDFLDNLNDPKYVNSTLERNYPTALADQYATYKTDYKTKQDVFKKANPDITDAEYKQFVPFMKPKEFKQQFMLTEENVRSGFEAAREDFQKRIDEQWIEEYQKHITATPERLALPSGEPTYPQQPGAGGPLPRFDVQPGATALPGRPVIEQPAAPIPAGRALVPTTKDNLYEAMQRHLGDAPGALFREQATANLDPEIQSALARGGPIRTSRFQPPTDQSPGSVRAIVQPEGIAGEARPAIERPAITPGGPVPPQYGADIQVAQARAIATGRSAVTALRSEGTTTQPLLRQDLSFVNAYPEGAMGKLQAIASEGKVVTSRGLAARMNIPFEDAQALYKQLRTGGYIDAKGKLQDIEGAYLDTRQEFKAAPMPKVDEPVRFQSTESSSTPAIVVESNPVHAIVQDQAGTQHVITPDNMGEHSEIVRDAESGRVDLAPNVKAEKKAEALLKKSPGPVSEMRTLLKTPIDNMDLAQVGQLRRLLDYHTAFQKERFDAYPAAWDDYYSYVLDRIDELTNDGEQPPVRTGSPKTCL